MERVCAERHVLELLGTAKEINITVVLIIFLLVLVYISKEKIMTIYYAGIGARKTPKDVCRKMFTAGRVLASMGFVLRSGGAKGADSSFESGHMTSHNEPAALPPEIYLPFKRFNNNNSPLFGTCKESQTIASRYHPRWSNLSWLVRSFHARNVYQLLGANLNSPAAFVICWTSRGAITGGTGQTLRMAQDYDIPILNFATEDDETISNFILNIAEKIIE